MLTSTDAACQCAAFTNICHFRNITVSRIHTRVVRARFQSGRTEMATWAWIVIVIVVAIIVAALATVIARRRSSAALRERFGTEYERTVAASDSPRAAEAELRGRERERRQLDIKPLSDTSRARYAGEWRAIQERFVDQPAESTGAADSLLHQVMQERGYPVGGDFDAQ